MRERERRFKGWICDLNSEEKEEEEKEKDSTATGDRSGGFLFMQLVGGSGRQ